jgi:hypothetical protein
MPYGVLGIIFFLNPSDIKVHFRTFFALLTILYLKTRLSTV